MGKVDTDLLNIIKGSILATFTENDKEATREEAQAFATSAAEEVVKEFEEAVAQASVHSIPGSKMLQLVAAIAVNMQK